MTDNANLEEISDVLEETVEDKKACLWEYPHAGSSACLSSFFFMCIVPVVVAVEVIGVADVS